MTHPTDTHLSGVASDLTNRIGKITLIEVGIHTHTLPNAMSFPRVYGVRVGGSRVVHARASSIGGCAPAVSAMFLCFFFRLVFETMNY